MKAIVLDELLKGPQHRIKRDPLANWLAQWNVPSIELIAKARPGRRIVRDHEGNWLLLRGSRLERPQALKEASRIYYDSGETFPGPFEWFEDVLLAKRQGPLRTSYRSTLHCPVDLFGNLDEQFREMRDLCRAARKELIAVSGKVPPKRGRKRETLLAENILMLIRRHWGKESIASIASTFYGSDDDLPRQLAIRRICDTKMLLRAYVKDLPARLKRSTK